MFFTNYSKALLVIVLMLSASLLAGDDNEPKWGKVTDAEWQIGPPVEYPEANAVIIFDRGSLYVSFDKIELERHVRLKILTKAGIEEMADLGFSYHDDDKIKGFEAQTITPDGKKIAVDKKNVLTKTSGNWKTRTFAFSAVDSGCILEFKYANVNERYHYLDPWYFQSSIFTMESVFKLCLAAGFTYSTAVINMPAGGSRPAVSEENQAMGGGINRKMIIYTYKLNNMPPVRNEPYMGFPRSYMAAMYNQLVSAESPGFYYSYVKDWPGLGSEFQDNYLKDYLIGAKSINALTDSLTGVCTNQEDKAKAVYDYVAREIKLNDDESVYFSNENITQNLTNKYGTISDKNVLLTEMLKRSGLEAWPVLIGSRNDHIFMPELYHLRQFDYLITACKIDGGFVFLDAQSEYIPFGILPPESRVNGGLILDGGKSYLAKITYENPQTRRYDHTIIMLDSMGAAACSTHVDFQGYLAFQFGQDIAEEIEEDLIKGNFLDRLDLPYQIAGHQSHHETGDRVSLDVSYSLEGLVSNLDNHFVLKPVRFFFRENPFTNQKRFFPVDFEYPRIYQNHCEITLAEGMSVMSLPEPVKIEIDGASFSTQYLNSGQSLSMLCTLQISQPAFPHYKYEVLKKFFDQVAASMEDRVILSVAAR